MARNCHAQHEFKITLKLDGEWYCEQNGDFQSPEIHKNQPPPQEPHPRSRSLESRASALWVLLERARPRLRNVTAAAVGCSVQTYT